MQLTTRKRIIRGTIDVAPVFREILLAESEEDQAKEHFWICCLNTKNHILRIELISLGTLDHTVVHPREIYRPAIGCSAKTIVLAHNHPSGDPTPSDMDVRLTAKLIECGKILDIRVLDHVIIGEDRQYWSMREHTEPMEPGYDLVWE